MSTLVLFLSLLVIVIGGYARSAQLELRRLSGLYAQLQARIVKLETSRTSPAAEVPGADLAPPANESVSAEAMAESPPSAADTLGIQPFAKSAEVQASPIEPEPPMSSGYTPETFALPPIADKLWTVLKQNSFAAVGVALVLLGCSFLFPMLALHGLFPPVLRLALAALLGAGLFATGLRLSKRKPDYAHVLEGGGAGVLYLTTYAAMAFYELISAWPAFVIVAVFSAAVVGLSVRQAAKPLAFLGFAGAYLAPILTVRGTVHLDVVLAYGLLVSGASLYVGLHQRWIEMSIQSFIWSLLLAFGAYIGDATALPLWMQHTFLAAYFVLFTSYPPLYMNGGKSSRADAYSLQTMTGLLTPIVLGLEYWIGGKTGLTIAASLTVLVHIGLYFVPWRAATGFYAVHATLAILSAMGAIFAPDLTSSLTALLAGAVAVCIYLSLPGRLRWLGGAPGLVALGVGLSPLDAPSALVATAVVVVVGYIAVMRRNAADAWVIHMLSAVLSLVSGYALFRHESGGSILAFTLPGVLALTTGLGWWYRRAGNASAFVCHSVATVAVMLLSLLIPPVGIAAETAQVAGVIGTCALAGVLVHVYATLLGTNSRLFFVITVPVVLGVLAHQHALMADSIANHFALAGWVVLCITAVLHAPPLRSWIPNTPDYGMARKCASQFVLPWAFAIQWLHSVVFNAYPSPIALQALWMVSSAVIIARTVTRPFARAVVAGSTALLFAYFLALADVRAAITLAWAVTALAALVVGSRVNDRALWIVGAAISALVVAKLILLDLSAASSLWRVLSSIGSGLLFVLAGYLAPAPARCGEAAQR